MGVARKPVKGYLRSDFRDAWARYLPATGNNGNKSSAPHNDGVNAVTDNGNDSASEADLLPIGQIGSSASPQGAGFHLADREGTPQAKCPYQRSRAARVELPALGLRACSA